MEDDDINLDDFGEEVEKKEHIPVTKKSMDGFKTPPAIVQPPVVEDEGLDVEPASIDVVTSPAPVKKSMDGFKTPPATPDDDFDLDDIGFGSEVASQKPADVKSVDGFVNSAKPRSNDGDFTLDSDKLAELSKLELGQQLLDEPVEAPAKKFPTKTFLLVLFILLFVAAAASAGYFYNKNNHTLRDLTAKEAERSSAQQQLNNEIQTEQTMAADYATKLNAQKVYSESLNEAAQKLKTTCGRTCTQITIPEPPTATD